MADQLYERLADIGKRLQEKRNKNPYNPPYGETKLEEINGKKYYKTTSYKPVDEAPTVQDLRKALLGK